MKKFYLAVIVCLMMIVSSGCIKFSTQKKNTGPVGGPIGIHKTVDGAVNWTPKNSVYAVNGTVWLISDVSIGKIVFDPSDNAAMYLTTNMGLYVTYNAAEGWQQVPKFGNSPINDVAIDYNDKCNVFVTIGQSIFRSTDCLRTWEEVYFDSRAGLQIGEIETDHYPKNKNIVYATNSLGDLLKSSDFGKTWQTIRRFGNPIKQLLMDRNDSRIIFILTENTGVFKTMDSCKTWSDENPDTDINKALEKFSDSKITAFLVQDLNVTKKNNYILVSKFGLLKTADGGKNWDSIELITPERGTNIYSFGIDPKNPNNLFYGTDTTIYKTIDGGKFWSTQKSPTAGIITQIIFDPKDSKIMYLGAKAVPQK